MHTDCRGHAITTVEPQAAAALDQAIADLVGRRSSLTPTLARVRELDPDCVLGQVLTGMMGCGVRKQSGLESARGAHAVASAQKEAVTPRERLYIDVLESAIAREPDAVVGQLSAILEQSPTDLLASVLIQGELFWTGDMQRSAAQSSRVDSQWSPSVEGYADWLALRAFDLEETGELALAERLGRESVERDPHNLWGAHSVAHVLEMKGESSEGIRWLDGLKGQWDAGGPMKYHLWWHRCLCHIEQGEHDAALEIHDTWLRNAELPFQQALPDFYLDVQNGASNLIRLELQGVEVGDRWQALADAIEDSWSDLSNPFTTLHVAMVLAATGQHDRQQTLLSAVNTLVNEHDSSLATAYSGVPEVLDFIAAHRAGQHKQVAARGASSRDSLWRLGGSHAQRDVLFQLLFDSASRCQDHALINGIHVDLERIGFINPLERVAYQDAA
jgi:hypothetical protein